METHEYEIFDASSFFQVADRKFIPPDEVCVSAVEAMPDELKQAVMFLFFEDVVKSDRNLTEAECADCSVISTLLLTCAEAKISLSTIPKKIGFPVRHLRVWHELEAMQNNAPTSTELRQMFGE